MANITIDETINPGDKLRITLDGVDYDGYINSYGDFISFTDNASLPFGLSLGDGGGTVTK